MPESTCTFRSIRLFRRAYWCVEQDLLLPIVRKKIESNESGDDHEKEFIILY